MAVLMKGHTWAKGRHKVKYPVHVEVKYDEIRCRVKVDTELLEVQFLSYAEKPLHNLGHYSAAFIELSMATNLSEFDCGVLVGRSFSDTYRYVRSSRGIPDDLHAARVEFVLFDLPELVGRRFYDRMQERDRVARVACEYRSGLVLNTPLAVSANSEECVLDLYHSARSTGQEGVMVKSYDHLYERGKRTYGWLKMKPSDTADGIITGIVEAISITGEPLGRAGSINVRMEDGSVASPHGVPHDLGRDMFRNPDKYIGKQWCEFNYMERDRQGGYRHPTLYRLREEKQ